MVKCELNCHSCLIPDCGFRNFNPFDLASGRASGAPVEHTQNRAQLHTRIDATKAAKMFNKGSSGSYGGPPPAIETDPSLYVTDQLQAERNAKKA